MGKLTYEPGTTAGVRPSLPKALNRPTTTVEDARPPGLEEQLELRKCP